MRTGAEIKVGLITLLALILLAVYSFSIKGYRFRAARYSICVIFDSARGLQSGDPVRMAGVKIGEVTTVEIGSDLKARVNLAIAKKHELYENYRFQIASSGLIQERFVEVIPQPRDPYSAKLEDEVCVEGVLTPDISALVAAGAEVLDNLNRTSRLLNVLLSDQEVLTSLKRSLQSFSRAASSAARLADTTESLAETSQPEILAALRGLRSAAADLDAMTGELRARLTEGTTVENLEQTARYARDTAANAAAITGDLAATISAPEAQRQLRETIAAIHDAAQSAKKVGADLEVLSGELRKVAPAVPRVAREAEDVAETAGALRERLKPPEMDAAFDVVYGTEIDRTFSSAHLDFHTTPDRFLRVGVDDIGEESDVNFQVGEAATGPPRGRVRYGLLRSNLGVGFDFDLPNEITLSLDVFDPNDVRADLLADIPFNLGQSDFSFLLGARDIGDDELVVGGIRLKR